MDKRGLRDSRLVWKTPSALNHSAQQVGRVVESQFEFGASGQNRPLTFLPSLPDPSPQRCPRLPPQRPPPRSFLLHITPSKPLAAPLS